MAKMLTTDEIGKPGKPPKYRRFPWRLWLYAIAITGAAGAAGYYGWGYRQQAKDATEAGATCKTDLGKLQSTAADVGKQAADCRVALDGETKKAADLEKQNGEFTKNLNATKDELAQLRTAKAEADKRMAAIEAIRKEFAKMIDTGQLKVSARRGELVLSLPSEVLFPSGSAELSKEGELAVLEVGITLKKFPDRRFMVIGHTDNQPLAKPKDPAAAAATTCAFKDNWELSTARALTVTRFLVQAGMKAESIVPAGAGEHDPVASNGDAKTRAKNRRIEIALLPKLEELPPMPAGLTEEPPAPAPPGK